MLSKEKTKFCPKLRETFKTLDRIRYISLILLSKEILITKDYSHIGIIDYKDIIKKIEICLK